MLLLLPREKTAIKQWAIFDIAKAVESWNYAKTNAPPQFEWVSNCLVFARYVIFKLIIKVTARNSQHFFLHLNLFSDYYFFLERYYLKTIIRYTVHMLIWIIKLSFKTVRFLFFLIVSIFFIAKVYIVQVSIFLAMPFLVHASKMKN